MKRTNMLISVPQPCSESWNDMSQAEKGRFCQHCQKTVTDYSEMSDKQLIAAIKAAPLNSCGRFVSSQLDRELVSADSTRRPLLFTAILASFLATISPSVKANPISTVQLPADSPGNQNEHENKEDSSGLFVSGQIFDSQTKSVMQGALVQLRELKPPTEGGNLALSARSTVIVQAATDHNGRFSLFIPAEYVKTFPTLTVCMIGYRSVDVKPQTNAAGTYLPLKVKMERYIAGLDAREIHVPNRKKWLKKRLKKLTCMFKQG